jgi:transposase
MARQLEVTWQEDEATLFEMYKQETDHQKRTRLQGLWLLCKGRKLQEVANTVGVHYRTLQRWVGWYRQGGLAKVVAHRRGSKGGPHPFLTQAQEAELLHKSRAGELRSMVDGVAWAQEAYGVLYSYWGMRHVYERLGLKKKVPRPRSPKASEEAQAAWKKGA